MINLRKRTQVRTATTSGEIIKTGPEFTLWVDSLKKEFPVFAGPKLGTFLCEDEMTLKEALPLSTIEIPKGLFISFKFHNRNSHIFQLYSIEKAEAHIELNYFLSTEVYHNKEFKWSLNAYQDVLMRKVNIFPDISIEAYGEVSSKDMTIDIKLKTPLLKSVRACTRHAETRLNHLHRTVQFALGNFEWRKDYEKNEKKFSLEILIPLFRKMGFHNISYDHGRSEFGKDITFSEFDKFQQLKHYGVQVKAGNISGNVNSRVDEIIGQIEDAFSLPTYDVNSNTPKFISTYLIIISGHFTENAKEKIMHKIKKGLHGSILFIDQRKVQELIELYWIK